MISPVCSIYEEGEIVTLTAKPGSGYELKGWQGDASGGNTTIKVTMNGNKNIKAVYTRKPQQIQFHVQVGPYKFAVYSNNSLVETFDLQLGESITRSYTRNVVVKCTSPAGLHYLYMDGVFIQGWAGKQEKTIIIPPEKEKVSIKLGVNNQ